MNSDLPTPIDRWSVLAQPRVQPLPRARQSALMRIVLAITRTQTDAPGRRGQVLNIFGTFAHVPYLFYRWLFFAARLMPFGKLPRQDVERVILRVGHRTGSWYEWVQHVRLGQMAGLSLREIDTFRYDDHPDWSPRTRVLLHCADTLIQRQQLPDELWRALREHLSESLSLEFCLLVGHYVMLAMMLNTAGVPTEAQFARDVDTAPGVDSLPKF